MEEPEVVALMVNLATDEDGRDLSEWETTGCVSDLEGTCMDSCDPRKTHLESKNAFFRVNKDQD